MYILISSMLNLYKIFTLVFFFYIGYLFWFYRILAKTQNLQTMQTSFISSCHLAQFPGISNSASFIYSHINKKRIHLWSPPPTLKEKWSGIHTHTHTQKKNDIDGRRKTPVEFGSSSLSVNFGKWVENSWVSPIQTILVNYWHKSRIHWTIHK